MAYTPSGNPQNGARGLAATIRAEFALIAAAISSLASSITNLVVSGNSTLGDSQADTITLNGTVQPGVLIQGNTAGATVTIEQQFANAPALEIAGPTPFLKFNDGTGGTQTDFSLYAENGHFQLLDNTDVITLIDATATGISFGVPLTLGTPVSGDLSNCTGTAAGLSVGFATACAIADEATVAGFANTASSADAVAVGGITGLGANVATFLATPSSANLAAAVTDEESAPNLLFGDVGTYTPTASSLSGTALTGGLSTVTPYTARYIRVGNQCLVHGVVDVIYASSAGGLFGSFRLTFPIASTPGAFGVAGTAVFHNNSVKTLCGAVADGGATEMVIYINDTSVGASSGRVYFSVMYNIA